MQEQRGKAQVLREGSLGGEAVKGGGAMGRWEKGKREKDGRSGDVVLGKGQKREMGDGEMGGGKKRDGGKGAREDGRRGKG